MKAQSVGVRRQAGRPRRQPAVGPIERKAHTLSRRLTLDLAEVRRMETSLTRDRTLEKGGNSFNLPGRQKQIGKRHRDPAECRSHRPRPATRSVEMDDV